ncbi:hypothetical protein BC477_09345 [Clavibacter michiganensis subsp. michiganensis]|uniref:Uncharacterized protein n=1 Tax=Clavibacter michiganensis subsp. michiganensis TaxID=33013 RepID=A0A251XP03_CLAMM|nr:hypothetical protein BC477_09345 [Clavibacter michiganensis subsp. michiganensis]OUE04929.1 hypothetical protein CMMCAS07_08265 [Clavibacter michiganensis subsp. michiganensis]
MQARPAVDRVLVVGEGSGPLPIACPYSHRMNGFARCFAPVAPVVSWMLATGVPHTESISSSVGYMRE